MKDARILGVRRTSFGKFPTETTLSLQRNAALGALEDASVAPKDIDAVIAGYSTVSPHLMPANLIAEAIGAEPRIAFGMNVGGCTGLSMVSEAARIVWSGAAKCVLVVAGENRATGQSRQTSTATLAQVADQEYESPIGVTVPALYGLLASEYYYRRSLPVDSLAYVPVQMRENASMTRGAHFASKIVLDDVVRSRFVAKPLRLLECSPISDGGAAVVVGGTSANSDEWAVDICGVGSANRAQHITSLEFEQTGAAVSAVQALREARIESDEIDLFGVYDSFTVTLAMILEEIGFVSPGETGDMARAGEFGESGGMPLNLHGGLMSYGHSGVAGGLVHLVEVVERLRSGRALANGVVPRVAYLHGDGGIMSAHASMVLKGRC